MTKKTYQEKKEQARLAAIEWQYEQAEKDYSYGEVSYFQEYFTRLGKRYGLLKEFRENAII